MTAAATKGEKGRLWQGGPTVGRYEVGPRVKTAGFDVGGRVYEARNKESGAPALVVVPGRPEDPLPEATLRVRVYAEYTPAHYAVEMESSLPPTADSVEHAAGMLDVVTSALEGIASQGAEAKRRAVAEHLARPARPSQRTRAVPVPLWRRPRWAAAAAVVLLLAAATLLAACWPGRVSARGVDPGGEIVTRGVGGAGVEAVRRLAEEESFPVHIRQGDGLTRAMPKGPFKQQERPPCRKSSEVELRGGCWVQAKHTAPCPDELFELDGACYVPVYKAVPTPQSFDL